MKLTLLAAVIGTADAASFGYSRRARLLRKPGRAAGTLAGIGVWSSLAVSAAAGDRGRARALAAAALAMNGTMLGVHLRARVAGPRVWFGTGLAAAALLGGLRGR